MPKKKKAGKNAKNKKVVGLKRKLLYADIDGQVYGKIEKALGSRFFDVQCMDNVKRRCKVRKKRMKVKLENFVVVSLRDFDEKNADVIYVYDAEEVRVLQKEGILPKIEYSSSSVEDVTETENVGGFDFEDI
jgi:translation initiation factor 1A